MLLTPKKTTLIQSVFIVFFIFLHFLNAIGLEYINIPPAIINSSIIGMNGLLLLAIGIHIGQLNKTYSLVKIFISLLLIHCLLHFFYSVASAFFLPTVTVFQLAPTELTTFSAASLLSLLLIQLGRFFRYDLIFVATLTLILSIAEFVNPYWHLSIYLVPCTLTGFYLHRSMGQQIKSHTIYQFIFTQTLPLWFFLALIVSSFIALTLPLQITTSNQTITPYLFSIILALACLIFSASPFANHFFRWWMGWIGWITRTQINFSALTEPSVTGLAHIYQFFTYLQHSLMRVLLVITLSIVIVELPFRGWEINALLSWIENSTYFLTVSIIVIFSIYFIARSFFKRTSAAIITLLLVSLISTINYLKMQFLGVPFMPTDFHMANQAFSSLAFITNKNAAVFIYGLLIVSVFVSVCMVWKHHVHIINKNIWVFFRGLLAIGAVFLFLREPPKFFDESRLPNAWQMPGADQLYEYSGFFSSFIYKYIGGFNLEKPDNYSSNSVHLLAQKNGINTQRPPIALAQTRPHVIAIQSEAYWDPGQLSAELFPEGSPGDLHSICNSVPAGEQTCATGYVGVPSFGGMTANTEFEFLTGIPLHFFPGVAVPFVHFIEKPTPSIVWRFRQSGYHTLGVHSSEGWFWNRDKAYPRLGFREFKDVNYFENAERNQFYVTDKAMNKLLVQEIRAATTPKFIFSVTMANHGPFDDTRFQGYAPVPINWQAVPNLSESQHQALSTYAIGVREARSALADLVSEFQQENSPPVIIVFYGDHLPILGANFRIYHETGFKPETNNAPFQELYSTPYLVWSNRPLTTIWPKRMPVSLFGQHLAQAAGLGESGLEQTLQILGKTAFFNKPSHEDLLNNKTPQSLSDREKELRTLYKHAFFDAFFNQGALDYFGLSTPLSDTKSE
jgi:phosphoglycerol transferase MdoB-like AlkP superfamily enzyme